MQNLFKMQTQIKILQQTRGNVLNIVENLSIEQLNKIPPNFSNNVLWNFAHLVVTQQLLCYKLSGLPLKIPTDWVDKYRKGSKPEGSLTAAEIIPIKEKFVNLVDILQEDYENRIFQNYQSYPTSFGIELTNIEEAIQFNNVHEGLHLGYIMALRKSI